VRRVFVLGVAFVVLAAGGGWYAWSEVVPGAPAAIEIIPSSEVSLAPTARHRFETRVTDARGRLVDVRPTWTGDISVGPDGAFSAPERAGTYYLEAAAAAATTSAKVTVTPGAPRGLRVLPANATVKPRDNVAFSATAFDEWGNSTTIKPAWRVSGSGSIDEQGIYVAGTSGTTTITADVAGLSASAGVTTQCAPPRTETGAGLTFTVVCGLYADVWLNGTGFDAGEATRTIDDAVVAVEAAAGRTFRHRLNVSAFASKANFDIGLKQLYHVDAAPYEEGVFVPPAFIAIDWSAPDPPEAIARHEITHLVVAQAAITGSMKGSRR
jgi:hypothetical protein